MEEQRLLLWTGLPASSVLTISVDAGKYTVEGDARIRRGSSITHLTLGPAELVTDTFEVPFSVGTTFRLVLRLTYLALEETKAIVRVDATKADGEPVTAENGDPLSFIGEYTGRIGGDSPEDELIVIVAGEV